MRIDRRVMKEVHTMQGGSHKLFPSKGPFCSHAKITTGVCTVLTVLSLLGRARHARFSDHFVSALSISLETILMSYAELSGISRARHRSGLQALTLFH